MVGGIPWQSLYPNPIYSYLGLLLAHDTKISVHITWARKAGAYPAFYPCHRHLNSFAPHRSAGYTYEPLWSAAYVCFRSHVTLRVAGWAPYGCVKFPPACCRAGQYASLYSYGCFRSLAVHCIVLLGTGGSVYMGANMAACGSFQRDAGQGQYVSLWSVVVPSSVLPARGGPACRRAGQHES